MPDQTSLVDKYQYFSHGYLIGFVSILLANPYRLMTSNQDIKNKSGSITDATHAAVKLHDHFELILNWYKISGKTLTGEETLSGLHIQTLLKILGNPIWNHLYHCWQVESKHMSYLQPYVNHQFDSGKFIYFIEAYNTK